MRIYRTQVKNCSSCKHKLEPDLCGICLDCMSTYRAQGHYPDYESEKIQQDEDAKVYTNISVPAVTRLLRK